MSIYSPGMITGMLSKRKKTGLSAGHGKTLTLYITHILFTSREMKKQSLLIRIFNISNESWKSRAGSQETEGKKKKKIKEAVRHAAQKVT